MRMNKITLMVMGLAVASLLASCKKDNNNDTTDKVGFKATTEQKASTSRTLGVPNEAGSAMSVQWINGDQILIANQGGADGCDKLTYSLASGDHSTKGNFTSRDEDDDFLQPDYVAIYPATNTNDVANDIVKEGDDLKAVFNLPATQDFQRNSFAEKAMPMVAYSSEQELEFKNVLGGICFPLVGEGMTVTKIILASADPNEVLWGECKTTISTSDADPTSVVSNEDANKNCITLNCGSGIALGTNPTDFYVMVPAGTLETGFTVEAFNGETSIFVRSADWSANPQENFITRSVIRKVDHNLQIIHELDVTTVSPTFITKNSVLGIGEVSGGTVTERGICWALASVTNSPTIANEYLAEGGNEVGSFDVALSNLNEDQVYYVRAYAKNDVGIPYYGEPIPFATRYDYFSEANHGKGRGAFTVNVDGDQVFFSMGNLQYNKTTSVWSFMENQFDMVEMDGDVGTDYANQNIISLFGWGTSGINDYTPIATCYQPWATSTSSTQYNPYGSYTTNLNSQSGKADWGYNAISNGGNKQNSGWRTLQGYANGDNTAEWNYLLINRSCSQRYAFAELVPLKSTAETDGISVNGMILFPDNFVWPALVNNITSNSVVDFATNQLTEAEWSLLEQAGAIFLPAAGGREGNTVFATGLMAAYWSATYKTGVSDVAHLLLFGGEDMDPQSEGARKGGFSVRLVTEINMQKLAIYIYIDSCCGDGPHPMQKRYSGKQWYARTSR